MGLTMSNSTRDILIIDDTKDTIDMKYYGLFTCISIYYFLFPFLFINYKIITLFSF